jgi:plastocyanin
MPRKLLVLLAFLPVAFAVTFWHSGRDASGQTTTTVDVGDNFFCNSSFSFGVCDTNITAGDTVMWQWVGSAQHSVTQCGDQTFTTCPPLGGGFDSGFMTSGTFSQTFNTAGSFEYRCNIHTTQMHGRINVAAQQATATATAGPTTAGATPSPAQTSTTGLTASPTPALAAAPAAVPQTGGAPTDGGTPWALLLAASGAALIIGSGALAVRIRRR